MPQPAFAIELNRILDVASWRSFFGFMSIESQAARQLHQVLIGIRKREQTMQSAAQSLQKQRAEAHIIKGAVAAARARRNPDRKAASDDDHEALHEFQHALSCPTHRRDPFAKECVAFQFLRLGERGMATAAYEELEEFANDVADARTRDLFLARAQRYRAQILQANAAGGALGALGLIAGKVGADNSNTALGLRQTYSPYKGWEAIEQAEFHYVTAYIAFRLNAVAIRQRQLSDCEAVYKSVLATLPKRQIFVRKAARRLRAEAKAGVDRAALAKVDRFNENWLMI